MSDVFDVAQYIVGKLAPISTIKLQKLVYYCKAWSLVWDEDPLFSERIEAWANGPVSPDLYERHKGQFLSPANFKSIEQIALSDNQKETIDIVLQSYGTKSPQYLVALTHSEKPWIDARNGYAPGERCNVVITDVAMAEYYSSLV